MNTSLLHLSIKTDRSIVSLFLIRVKFSDSKLYKSEILPFKFITPVSKPLQVIATFVPQFLRKVSGPQKDEESL
jgi:hypothetical protein